MELSTLADVWILVEKHLPKEYRSKFTRRQLAGLLKRAAEGQQDVAEVSTALRIVLQLEGVKSPSFRAPPLTKPNVRLKKPQRSGFIQTLEYLAEIDRVRCQAACGTPGGSLIPAVRLHSPKLYFRWITVCAAKEKPNTTSEAANRSASNALEHTPYAGSPPALAASLITTRAAPC